MKDENEEVGLTPKEENPEPLPEDDSLASQIRELLADGVKGKDIIEMGYAESTVRQEARKFVKMNGKAADNGSPMLPVKLGKGDTIPIESEIASIVIDGDIKYKSGFLDGMRTLVIGAKLNQMLIAGLSETTASQLALLKEAKSDSKEVAQETVLEILPHFADMMKETARASSPHPMASMMSRMLESTMEPVLKNLMGMMMPKQPAQGQEQSQQGGLPPGWTNETGEK